MGLLDILTGGESSKASDMLDRAQRTLSSVELPTKQDLTLPELQRYVQMGILTPEEAKAMLVQGNAYDEAKIDPGSTEAQMSAINQLRDVADSGGMTGTMKAQLGQALDTVNTNTRGNNAAILERFAQQGIPSSLMAGAFQSAEGAQQARNANLAATQAAGQSEQNALNALMGSGNLAANLRGQQFNEASTKAAAENAIRQWNAGATNTASENNANRAQNAQMTNLGYSQEIANKNTDVSNNRTAYNANIPQQMFNNAVTKATGQANISGQQANQANHAGDQMMGLIGAGVGAAANAFAPGAGAAVPKPKPQPQEAIYMAGGGLIPGDSPKNDVIPARLSPGEGVIPRSIMNSEDAPNKAKNFVKSLIKEKDKKIKSAHPDDVRSVLDALTSRREKPVTGSSRG